MPAKRMIKLCGMLTLEHAVHAAQLDVEYIGVILAPSKRQISPAQARTIKQAIHAVNAQTQLVGVFVNQQPSIINQLVHEIGLDVVQLSGNETSDVLNFIDAPVFKAIRLSNDESEQDWIVQARNVERLHLLVDAQVAGSYGGAGVVADWQKAAQLAHELPVFLAGGLNPENVATAIRNVQPWGVDVSSGIETNGTKDIQKMTEFVNQAHFAFGALDSRRNND